VFKFIITLFLNAVLFSHVVASDEIKNTIKNSFSPGAFEIYMMPEKNNFIAQDDIEAKVWSSHIPEANTSRTYKKQIHSGVEHGSINEYDMHVPIILHGEKFIKKGKSKRRVFLTDIVPTLSNILKITTYSYSQGEPLKEAVQYKKEVPKIIMFFVIDQAGWNYFNAHKEATPFITSTIGKGYIYENAYLNFIQSSTAVSHAVIGTGALPKHTGVYDNVPLWNGVNAVFPIYRTHDGNYTIDHLKVPTLVDLWDLKTGNQAKIFVYSSAPRSAIGLAGHGKLFKGGDKDTVFWYSEKQKNFTTHEPAFSFPDKVNNYKFASYVKLNQKDQYWKDQTCKYKETVYEKCFMGSPAFIEFEGDVILSALKEEKTLGKDEIADLVFISFKGTDYCGHSLGSESLECGRTFAQVDRQIERIANYLNGISEGETVMVITADHGVAPLTELSGGSILNTDKLYDDINGKFIRDEGVSIVKKMSHSIMNLDLGLMKSKNIDISDIKSFLNEYKVNGKKFFKKIYTYKELEK